MGYKENIAYLKFALTIIWAWAIIKLISMLEGTEFGVAYLAIIVLYEPTISYLQKRSDE